VYFYSHEPGEPPHVHVDRENLSAKFWLRSVGLAANFGFSARELRAVEAMITKNKGKLLEAWSEYFGT
jgi:Domain of unknown function (DUF4160)